MVNSTIFAISSYDIFPVCNIPFATLIIIKMSCHHSYKIIKFHHILYLHYFNVHAYPVLAIMNLHFPMNIQCNNRCPLFLPKIVVLRDQSPQWTALSKFPPNIPIHSFCNLNSKHPVLPKTIRS